MDAQGVFGGGMWSIGRIGHLVLVLIVLGIAALVKYLRQLGLGVSDRSSSTDVPLGHPWRTGVVYPSAAQAAFAG